MIHRGKIKKICGKFIGNQKVRASVRTEQPLLRFRPFHPCFGQIHQWATGIGHDGTHCCGDPIAHMVECLLLKLRAILGGFHCMSVKTGRQRVALHSLVANPEPFPIASLANFFPILYTLARVWSHSWPGLTCRALALVDHPHPKQWWFGLAGKFVPSRNGADCRGYG